MEYTARMNEHALVSRAAAAGSCVLLKNIENTLPFAGSKDEPVRVAVFGPPASRTRFWRTNTARGRSSTRREANCRSEASALRSSPP